MSIIVNADEFRKYHPRLNQIVDKYGDNYAEHTAQFSGQVAERVIALGIEKKFNIVVEGTFRTAETPLNTLQNLKDNDYNTRVYIKAENADVAWNNTLKRAELERERTGVARTVSREHFDKVCNNLGANVDAVYGSEVTDTLKIYTAKGIVFNSDESGDNPVPPSQIIGSIQEGNVAENEEAFDVKLSNSDTEAKKKTLKNGFVFGDENNTPENKGEKLDLSVLMNQVTHERIGNAVRYYLSGQPAFEDHASGIYMASEEAASTKEMVLVALQTAAVNYAGAFTITGDDEFKQRVYNLISEYGIKVSLKDPAQREALRHVKQQHIEREHPQPETPSAKEIAQAPHPISDVAGRAGNSHDTAQSGADSENQLSEESANGKKRNFNRGELLDFGEALYRHKEDEKMSYFIKIQNEHGIKELWGVDFKRALQDAGVKRGDIISAEYLGHKKVEVDAPVRNEEGKILYYTPIITNRNEWKINVEYPKPTTQNPTADRPDTFVSYDALTFSEIRQSVRESIGVLNPNAKFTSFNFNESTESVWFFENGKPVPDNVPKPAIPSYSDKNRLFGEIVFSQKNQNSNTVIDALFLASRDGFMQGVIRNPQTDIYEDVIAKQVTAERDGKLKSYFTLSRVQESGLAMIGYGHVSADTESLVYKLEHNDKPQQLTLENKDLKAMPVFGELFRNTLKPQPKSIEQAEQVKRHEQNITSRPMPAPKM